MDIEATVGTEIVFELEASASFVSIDFKCFLELSCSSLSSNDLVCLIGWSAEPFEVFTEVVLCFSKHLRSLAAR